MLVSVLLKVSMRFLQLVLFRQVGQRLCLVICPLGNLVVVTSVSLEIKTLHLISPWRLPRFKFH